ncbi:hypothetical protein A3860_38750 [Niastella vici]|uniref:Thioredoxin domain-containing protein n=1 Tax=Niastella vici TaxID=1703345 RepID=A0A1V9FLD2_9BACT|nr:thioredoxin family protein [Niastella vici]OQP59111.1 hypothetical protein A3860_38750 [Niastella vici]
MSIETTSKQEQMMYMIRILVMSSLTLLFFTVEARLNKNNQSISNGGIQWVSGLTWNQIIKQAHDQNKYIFMDCFATWCRPCKVMDKQVYPNDTVGQLMKSGFICVRMQMDSTKNDDEETKKWYSVVKTFEKEYSVNAMPTFLIFAPNGKIVHKDVGGKNVKQFIALIEDATDTTKQYYRLVEQYNKSKLKYAQMPALAQMARSVGEKELSIRIMRTYMTEYLDKDQQNYFRKENQRFICDFSSEILRSDDKLFLLYLQQSKKMDSLFGKPGYSQQIVDYVITKEEIIPAINGIKSDNELVWQKISDQIQVKYSRNYAERTVLNERINFYKSRKDWQNYAKYLVQKVQMEKQQGLSSYNSASFLNDYAWEIFLYSNSKADLKKALEWSSHSLQLIDSSSFNVGPNMDTRANLLYKLGKSKAAIKQEEDALERIISDSKRYSFLKASIDGYKKILQNMKEGVPTYLEQGAIWGL